MSIAPSASPRRAVKTPKAVTLSGGPAVMIDLLSSRLNCAPDLTLAQALWTECEAHLRAEDLTDIIEEVQESTDGGLDTYPREYVLDALGQILVGLAWPMNLDGAAYAAAFREKMSSVLTERGFLLSRSKMPAQT